MLTELHKALYLKIIHTKLASEYSRTKPPLEKKKSGVQFLCQLRETYKYGDTEQIDDIMTL